MDINTILNKYEHFTELTYRTFVSLLVYVNVKGEKNE